MESKSISGLAIVFYNRDAGSQFQLGHDAVERIMPDVVINQHDVIATFNHNADNILGRVSSNRLTISRSDKGIEYTIKPSKSQIYQEVRQHIADGNIVGSSFTFVPVKEKWRMEGGIRVREIHEIDLYELGPVTMPAYTASIASVRSCEKSYQDFVRSELHKLKCKLIRFTEEDA